jgi:hypothetical protein
MLLCIFYSCSTVFIIGRERGVIKSIPLEGVSFKSIPFGPPSRMYGTFLYCTVEYSRVQYSAGVQFRGTIPVPFLFYIIFTPTYLVQYSEVIPVVYLVQYWYCSSPEYKIVN